MDPQTSTMLFVLTVFLHACTFFFLQNVASCFKDYISPLEGVVLALTQEPTPPGKQEAPQLVAVAQGGASAGQYKQQQQYHGSRLSSATTSAASYHALHDSLDVSVFW